MIQKLPHPVKARVVKTLASSVGRRPGAIAFGETFFTYRCPCGCGRVSPAMLIRKPKGPELHPSWSWDGNSKAPTLSPSINHEGHWHGWLKKGEWTDA